MFVNIYESDGVTPYRARVDIYDAIPDDDERIEAMEELERMGRAWIGGGAAQLFYLTRAA